MFANIASLFALIFSVITLSWCIHAIKWLRENVSPSIEMRQLTEIQTELTDHADSIRSVYDSLKKLRSRIGMRNLREDRKLEEDLPDSTIDPQGWKDAMRLRLHSQRFK